VKSKINEKSFLSVLISVLILLNINLAGCKKDDSTSDTSITDNLPNITGYPIVGTKQTKFYNNSTEISAPSTGSAFYGQNAMYSGNAPKYVNNGDGTVTDLVTGLMWQQTPDRNGDGTINSSDKVTWSAAGAGASSCKTGGRTDWRLPTIKELYSLIIFSGVDPILEGTSTSGLTPFINTDYFKFGYGDVNAGERIIDAQFVTATKYVDFTMIKDVTAFGVNFADGRIKGYGLTAPSGGEKTFYLLYVRGNSEYGKNKFTANSNGTISDNATGLMWKQEDSGVGMNWQDALSYAENMQFASYSDWRLPNAKELQSIVDYTRSPSTTNSAAIDPLFKCTQITNEAGTIDYPFYWTNTTHAKPTSGSNAAYMCFGRAMGYMVDPMNSSNAGWIDVHGAGCQRSDPKTGNASDFPHGFGPQGDAIRILNYVRLVRNIK
jgi:hypothetical protein